MEWTKFKCGECENENKDDANYHQIEHQNPPQGEDKSRNSLHHNPTPKQTRLISRQEYSIESATEPCGKLCFREATIRDTFRNGHESPTVTPIRRRRVFDRHRTGKSRRAE